MEHNGCAPSLEKEKGPRCATEVDKQGNLQKWARCNKFCSEDPGMKIFYILVVSKNCCHIPHTNYKIHVENKLQMQKGFFILTIT